jgi:outer membrane receptor protein involved in Fe transport
VVNQNNKPIELAEVLLVNKDSITIKNEFTKPSGAFSLAIEKGDYVLQLRQLGKIMYKQAITVIDNLDLGTITITESKQQLEEVTVTSKKKLIERKVDRLVFNVENSISASGGNALDALTITPSVKVLNEKISLVGKSDVQIMIDGRMLQLSDSDLSNYLKSLSANDIKKIEVITTPPAKYDASGNSGIVNIILKNAKKNSWNASINANYTQKTYASESINGSLNYKKDKLSFYASLNGRDATKLNIDNNKIFYSNESWSQNNPRKVNDLSLSERLGLDYDINKRWTSGFQYMGSLSKSNINENSLSTITNNVTQQVNYFIGSKANTIGKPKLNSINWHTIFSLDTIGKKISVDLNYFDYKNKNNRDYNGNQLFNNGDITPNSYFAAINSNNQNITNYSGKLDFELPTKLLKLDFGGKISKSITNNDIAFYNNETGNPIIDATQTNIFEYNENIQAVYITGNKKLGAKWESQIGLRLETTQTNGFSKNLNQTNTNNYTKLFPTAYLVYTPNDNNNFSINYSRRIERPNYQQLNPFKMYDSPYIFTEGNPFLQPSFSDNFELLYTYKKLENKFYVSNVTNGFEQIGIVESNTNITRYFVDNFLATQNYGISENYTFNKLKWWTCSISLDMNYIIAKSNLAITQKKNDGYNTYLSFNNDVILNKNKTFLFNSFYWYNFPGAFGIYKNTAYSSLSLTLKYLLLNKDLQLSLSGNDIFSGQRSTYTSYINNIRQEFRNYYDSRSFSISLLYKFGNKKISVKPREFGNEEEKNRAN